MQYADLADYYNRIEETTKRLDMTELLVELLREADADEVDAVAYLTMGKLGPAFTAEEVGLAEKLVLKALTFTTGLDEGALTDLFHELGDLGSAAEHAHPDREPDEEGAPAAGARQTTLFGGGGDDGKEGSLSVREVHEVLTTIARTTGQGSQERKVQLLHRLLVGSTPRSARYIVRTVTGKLRLGVAEMTIVDALAHLATFPPGSGARSVSDLEEEERRMLEANRDTIEAAFNRSSDLGRVTRLVKEGGVDALDEVSITVGVPLRPMLAERLSSAEEILEKTGGRALLEYKYDGLRLQAHIDGDEVRFFSRRLEDMGGQFPDVARFVREAFQGSDAIVEGEVVAIDEDTGALLPFQEISKRRGRKHDVERMTEEVPVALYLFDALYLDGTDLTGHTLPERREALEEAFEATPRVHFSHAVWAEAPDDVVAFFDASVADGAEGIMAKSTGEDSTYRAGARGWQWIKYKKDYSQELTDSLDLVVVGAYAGQGRRRGWYGSLLMATYDHDRDVFQTVCRVATGFEDEDLEELKPMFEDHVLDHKHPRVEAEAEPDVWIAPARVAEVVAAEISVSPVHTTAQGIVREGSGLALRFPRFMGWRPDKAPEDATTGEEVVHMYRVQLGEDPEGGSGDGSGGGEA